MVDRFTCNFCGKEMDTGYFYCEKCHRIHKEQQHNKAVDEPPENNAEQLFNQIGESESKQP